MQHITGISKYRYLLKALNREVFNLPLGFILFMFKQMSYEKLTIHDDKIFINTIYTPLPSSSYNTALRCFVKLSKGVITPFSAYISVTDKCHLNCWHCNNANKEISGDLSFEDLSRIIKEVQETGVSCIGFTGGEPALRSDLTQLISKVDGRSFTILFTTGHRIDKERAIAFKKAGLTAIVVSLDSHIKKEHNQKRSSDSAFDDAVLAIKNCLQTRIYTAVSCVITKEMLYTEKIYEFVHYVAGLGVPEIRILEPQPCGKLLNGNYDRFEEQDRNQIRKLQYEINRNKTLPKIMSLAHINSKDNYGCNAGRTHIYINASGEVCPCDFTPFSFGSLLKEPFHRIYNRMNSYFPKPSSDCIISSISKQIKEVGNGRLPIKDIAKIEHLLRLMGRSPIPKLFIKLGVKGEGR
ncbi:MAG: radical SAM protein [Candidatus Omnitrophica bacterium]|nr:radical SAM protein [Candidatus Omnitrophota bacterium]